MIEHPVAEKLKSFAWRINNLYYIKDPAGQRVLFKPNWAQKDFLQNMDCFNVILKARQLGFSNLILLYLLDAALFNKNHACGVIAQGLNEATDLFDNKIKFAYDNLPEWLREAITCDTDNARQLKFSNGSTITVGTSLRGGTFQKLHVSEYGKISAKYPDKAQEIKTGALNTVHVGQQIFIESTAEGQGGDFYELVKRARLLVGKSHTPLDPKFHFYPWWKNPLYVMDDESIVISPERTDYFNQLRKEYDIVLSRAQQNWYVKKLELLGEDMLREYPSTPDESFASSIEGSIYGKQMALLRHNKMICRVPWEPRSLVHTFWDLGNYDYTAIWFFQHVGKEYRMIRYLQAAGTDLTTYAEKLRSFGYSYGKHYLPHDGARSQLSLQNKSIKAMLEELGIKPIQIIPRTNSVRMDIETKCKVVLPRVWFDEVLCADGIKCLDNYSKVWDDRLGVWKEEPKHDMFSHGCDAFRSFAVGYREQPDNKSVSFSISGLGRMGL